MVSQPLSQSQLENDGGVVGMKDVLRTINKE